MAEVRSGSFNTTGYSDPGYTDHYVFSWELVSQSIVDCTSTIKWSVVGAGGTNSAYWTYVQEKYVTVNGSTQTNITKIATSNGTVAFSGQSVIKHSTTTGKGSFSASCGGAFYYYGSYNSTGSGTWDLPTIARATVATTSASTVTMGGTIQITLKPADSSFKHKLSYSFGSLSYQTTGLASGTGFTASGNVTVNFTPPTTLGSQIPNANSGDCYIKCDTYKSDGTHVGSTVKMITLSVPSYTPSATISLTGVNLLSGAYVENRSTATVTITAATSYGATIKSYSTVMDGKTYTTPSFTTSVLTSGTKTAKTTITDSRGKTVTADSSSITVYAYDIPYITTFTLTRQSTATTVVAAIKGGFSSVNSKNAKTVKVTLNGVTNTVTLSAYTFDTTTTFTNVPTDTTLTGTLTLTDSYTTVTKDVTLPTVAVTMDFYKDGKGVAFGKVAEVSGLLDVAWSIRTAKPEKTLNNLSYRGTNLIAQNADDTTQNWSNQGNLATTFYDDRATGITKPSTWGFLVNVTTGPDTTEAHQLWFEQSNGNVLHRGGNSSGFGAWKTLIDSSNFASNFNTNFSSSFSSSLNATIKDYVVEQGSNGIWDYRKWNSGIAECWGNVSITPTTGNATNSTTVTLPFAFISNSSTSYKVDITPAKTAMYITSFGDCNSSNAISHTTTTFVMSYKYNNATPYAVSFNVTVKGRWK